MCFLNRRMKANFFRKALHLISELFFANVESSRKHFSISFVVDKKLEFSSYVSIPHRSMHAQYFSRLRLPPPTFQKRDIFLLLTKDTQLCIVFLFCKLGKVISFSPPSSNVCETECVRESVRARVCVRTSRSEVWVEGCHLLQLQSYGKRIKLYSPSIQSYEDIQHFPSHSL